MTTPPKHGGYAWTEWLAREMENDPMPETPAESAVTIESVEAHVRGRNNGELPVCQVCEEAPVLIKETDLLSDEPTGRTVMLLGKPMHVRRAVIVACSAEEECSGVGIEITGPTAPKGTSR